MNPQEPLKSPDVIRVALRVDDIPYHADRSEVLAMLADYAFYFNEIESHPKEPLDALLVHYKEINIKLPKGEVLTDEDWMFADSYHREKAMEIHFRAVQIRAQYCKLAREIHRMIESLCYTAFGVIATAS